MSFLASIKILLVPRAGGRGGGRGRGDAPRGRFGGGSYARGNGFRQTQY